MAPRQPRRWRAGHARGISPSLALLLCGIALLVAAAFQALLATRSHRDVVREVLVGYAQTAHWNYRRQLRAVLMDEEEHVFHPTHRAHPDSVMDEALLPPASAVVHEPHGEGETCGYGGLGVLRSAFRFALNGGRTEVGGPLPPGLDLPALERAIRAHVRTTPPLHRTERVLPYRFPSGPGLVLYTGQRIPGDTMIYALVVDSAAAAPLFRFALSIGSLLPEPLTRGRKPEELLSVQIASDAPLFRSAPASSDAVVYAADLGEGLRGLRAAVGLRADAARLLVVGGLPKSRLPLLLGLIGVAVGLVAIAFRQLRRGAELARLRAGFVSSVSHELRTPLALQRVFLDTIKLGRADGAAERGWAIENIDRETLRLTHLVENILHFSRTEQGTARIRPEPADVSRAIRGMVEQFLPLAAPAEARVALDVEDGIEAPVDLDALRQVVANLLENAVKYGPRGQTIRVALRLEGGRAVLEVDDEGPGIAPEERDAIWAPFERGRSAERAAAGGSGIGLAVVRELVRLHGGEVGVVAAPTGGARFRVVLPHARRRSAPAESDARRAPRPATARGASAHG